MHEEFRLRNSVAAARFVFDRETHIMPDSILEISTIVASCPPFHFSQRQIITYDDFLRKRIYIKERNEKDWIAKENKKEMKKMNKDKRNQAEVSSEFEQ